MNRSTSANPAFLHSIGTSVPDYQLPQSRIKEFMINTARADLDGSRADSTVSFIRSIYENSDIDQRSSTIPDFGASEPADHSFFPPNRDLEPLPTTDDRMRHYETEAPELAERAGRSALRQAEVNPREVTHLVFTSCTGHFAPGPGTKLIQRLGLSSSVRRILVGFMGCYAGFNTLRTAAEIVRGQPSATVLMVCLELCTLHFQKDFSRNGIVSDCLFSDGCAASVVTGPDGAARSAPLALLGPSHCQVDAEQEERMTWRIGDHGFNMYLDPEVPDRLKPHIEPFVNQLLQQWEEVSDDIQEWAVHPGGSKILDIVCEVLELAPKHRLSASRDILRTFGNMSSPTIFFILNRIIGQTALDVDTCALGFGPGLSLEGMLLFPPNRHPIQ
jgi:predicted naringenin-chalcone synthase